MIGVVAVLILLVIVGVAIPVRFMRAVRRSLRDPEFRALFVLVVLTLATGTFFYAWIEGWSLLDAFYFSAITLTTVGYGDLAPVTAEGKLFTVFYIFAGIGIIVSFVDAVARASVKQRAEARRLRGRREVSGSEDD
ncbi:MAG: two pore domain potassium channel family protein [Rubrobacter sp.]|nr:two pore domain potassium channel family protein [Rubrobacter sp.]